jgi:hypothetical protein
MTTAAGETGKERVFPRHFRGGLSFKTLCRDCNSGLGGREDLAIASFYEQVRKLLASPLILGPVVRVPVKPNLLYRGLLAHVVSANDNNVPDRFDDEARALFFHKLELRNSSWNLFYWLYFGDPLFLMRNVFYCTWHPTVQVHVRHILKLAPLGFLLTREPHFHGLPNVRQFLCRRDDEEAEMPIQMRGEASPVWPATTSNSNVILLGGNSFGLVGSRGK